MTTGTVTDNTTRAFEAGVRPANISAYELRVRLRVAGMSPQEITYALHVAQYAARIALDLGLDERKLWCLAALSAVDANVLMPTEEDAEHVRMHRRFLATGVKEHGWTLSTDIVQVANYFETGVSAASATRCESSPADTFRSMERDRGRFNALVVAALRRALKRNVPSTHHSPPLAA